MVSVLVKENSPRLEYTAELIFKEILGVDYLLVLTDKEKEASDAAWINYTGEYVDGMLNVFPDGLLHQDDIRKIEPTTGFWDNIPVLFMQDGNPDVPCDPFTMSFYLVSRYEEYQTIGNDIHGRFRHVDSAAHKYGFLNLPVVNILATKIIERLSSMFPGKIKPVSRKYRFIPTVDVDIAYAHLSKGVMRQAGGYGKLIMKGKVKEIVSRTATLWGMQKDPYDNFDLQAKVFSSYGLDAVYFFLLGDYGKYDKNVSWKDPRFRKLIRKISQRYQTGLHPSYMSHGRPDLIRKEKERLAEVTGKEVTHSRQHFIRLTFPDTYRNLLSAGITDDYSMGYPSANGFRAGIATPFCFYDLPMEKKTALRIHPFAFMDTTLSDYLSVMPADYIKFVEPLIHVVKQVKGDLYGTWHNYALSDDPVKHKAFKDIIKKASHA